MPENDSDTRTVATTLKPKTTLEPYVESFWIGAKPDPKLTVSEWADEYRVLSSKTSAEAGKWKTSRTPYLKEIMDCLSPSCAIPEIIFMKGSQIGGPLHVATPIPTPQGWTKMGDLKVGDWVFDEIGNPTLVLGVSPVFRDRACFEITFSDRSTIITDGVHRWTVDDDKKSGKTKKKTLTTKEIRDTFRCGENRNRYAIPVAPLCLPNVKLPVDPYTFGVWLGDGNSWANQITTHRDDAREMARYISQGGHKAVVRKLSWEKGKCLNIIIDPKEKRTDGKCRRGHVLAETGQMKLMKQGKPSFRCLLCNRPSIRKRDSVILEKPSFFEELRDLGLVGNKRIPSIFLRASIHQRLLLLQGIMDTDGHVVKTTGRCEITIASEKLKDDCVELIRSLGLKPTVSSRISTHAMGKKSKSPKPHFRIGFMAYSDFPVARLKRKKKYLVSKEGKRISETFRRRIIDVKSHPSVPVRCIQVASKNNLFLAGEAMIATHNTECGNNWLGFIIDVTSGATMAVQPTVDLAKRNSKLRIDPMIEDCERIRSKVREMKIRKGGPESDTVLLKEFPGGVLIMSGANSAAGLRSMPCRFIFLDEVDAYPDDVDGEGDPVQLAKARTRTFSRRKIFAVSTPTIEGKSRIKSLYELSDKRRFHLPCPMCGHFQYLKWENIIWPKGEPQKACYRCEGCRGEIQNHQKTEMLAAGKWISESPGEGKSIGFHLSALYSPVGWYSWGEAAKEFLKATKEGPEKLKVFVNTILGETWKEKSDAPDWKKLYDRRELYPTGKVPLPVVFLTMGVDVQKDRLEYEVVGWGKGKSSWSIDRGILQGDTSTDEPWDELDKIINRQFPRDGSHVSFPIRMTAIDSAYNTNEVYSRVRKKSPSQVIAVKGVDRAGLMVGAPSAVDVTIRGTRLKKGFRYYPLGVGMIKSELYGWLQLEQAIDGTYPPGYCHFPQYDDEYFKQLTAERLVTHKVKGYNHLLWEKHRDRNEALDLRVYARAAANLLGMDRLKDDEWDQLIAEVEGVAEKISIPVTPKEETRPAQNNVTQQRTKRNWF